MKLSIVDKEEITGTINRRVDYGNDYYQTIVLPKINEDPTKQFFYVMPGLLSPTGKTGADNPVFKMLSIIDLQGYKYRYMDQNGNKVDITIEITPEHGE